MSMVPHISNQMPPFVRFEERELGIDPKASEEAGRPVPRVVVMACVTSHGSKDVFEKPAEEWLKDKKQQVMNGTFNSEWLARFELQLSEWKKGNELPREGTPVKTWQMCSKEQGRRLVVVAGIECGSKILCQPADRGLRVQP